MAGGGGGGDVVLGFSGDIFTLTITVELQWLEHLWDHENSLKTGVVRASEG